MKRRARSASLAGHSRYHASSLARTRAQKGEAAWSSNRYELSPCRRGVVRVRGPAENRVRVSARSVGASFPLYIIPSSARTRRVLIYESIGLPTEQCALAALGQPASKRLSIAVTACCAIDGVTCEYRSSVIPIEACPSISETTFVCTPLAAMRVAAVWRRS